MKKALNISLRILLWFFVVVLLIAVAVQTAPVQNFAKKQVVSFLQKKLKTHIEIGRVRIGFPSTISIENIYVEDKTKDTLLYGGRIKANISLFKLLKNEVSISDLRLQQLTAKIKRQMPDTVYNFQFVVDAFVTENAKPANPSDTASMKLALDNLYLDDIRFLYKDTISGNDWTIQLKHFDTRIKTIDPAKMVFDIPSINLDGLTARMYQSKPLITAAAIAADGTAAAAAMPTLRMRQIRLKNIDVDYKNNVSALYTIAKLADLDLRIKETDLNRQRIILENVKLTGINAAVLMGKSETAQLIADKAEKEATDAASQNWYVAINDLRLQNSNIQYDDANQVRQPKALDYGHLKANDVNLQVSNVIMNMAQDSIAATIAHGAFKEQSGFNLEELKGDLLYTSKRAYARNLLVQTPGTRLQHTIQLDYPSIESIQKNISQLQIQAELPDCYVSNRDILYLMPDLKQQPMFRNPATVFKINADVSGRVDNLTAKVLQLEGWGNTRIDVAGRIVGLPNIEKVAGDIRINEIRTTRQDANLFLPDSIRSQINIPNTLRLTGTARGNQQNLQTNLRLNTSSGNVVMNGTMANYQNTKAATYNLQVLAQQLNIGSIIKDTSLSTISASVHVRGKGLTPETADATLDGNVQSVVYQKYNYRDVELDGSIKNQLAKAKMSIEDPNIHLAGNISVNLALTDPAIIADVMVDSIKTKELHLTAQTFIYRGRIIADLPNVNPDSLQGNVDIIHSLVVTDQGRLQLDTIKIIADQSIDSSRISLVSDIARARMAGNYKLSQLGTIFQQALQPYFTIAEPPKQQQPVAKTDPYNFRIGLYVIDNPALKVFMPTLQRFQSLRLTAHFASDSGWKANGNLPVFVNGGMSVEDVDFHAGARDSVMTASAHVATMKLGGQTIYNLFFNASAARDSVNFATRFSDQVGRLKYSLAGALKQPEFGVYDISLKSDSMLLNYEQWTVAPNNKIHLGKNDIRITDFMLNRNFQQISIKSRGEGLNAPAEASFTSFQISTLAAFVSPDSLGVDGTLDGQIMLRDLMKQPVFVGDLVINNLNFKKDTLGNVAIKANNTTPDVIQANVELTGRGNHATIDGNYFLKQNNGNDFNFKILVDTLNMATIEGATMGAISNASGNIRADVSLTGTAAKPNIDGAVSMKQTSFNLTMLNSVFTIPDETITLNNEGIRFDRFEILDSAKNKATLDGMVYTNNFTDMKFDLSLKANNFQAMNSTKQQNRLYWGKLFFSTNMKIEGTATQPVVDGSLTIADETNVTFALPQQEPGVVSRDGIVQFVDMDAPENDTLFLREQARYDSLNRSPLIGMDININLEIKKEALFSVVIDEGNGDFVRMQGEGMITGGIDPSGKITMSGTYEIQNGAYEMSYNLLKRKFTIQQGSRITWNGEPTMADLDVTAIYTVKTAPLDLMSAQESDPTNASRTTYMQRIPFNILLQLQGELMQPKITFDIKLPDGNAEIGQTNVAAINTRLAQLRQEPSELNKQVFAVLLLNRFVQENPFESSAGGVTPEYMARQSASRLLSEQLNKMAGDLINGVDINFDLTSYEDFSTGNSKARTDLNVSLSKRLMNDRLTVTVGNNFGLEGAQNTGRNSSNLAGNVAVDYSLSKDGRYRMRAYRKNEYEGIIEGYVIETGVGFIITLDYNKFKNLFLSQKDKEERRQRRQQQRAAEEQQKQQTTPATPTQQTTLKPPQNQELEKREDI